MKENESKSEVEALSSENKELKARISLLEEENQALKREVSRLLSQLDGQASLMRHPSIRHSAAIQSSGRNLSLNMSLGLNVGEIGTPGLGRKPLEPKVPVSMKDIQFEEEQGPRGFVLMSQKSLASQTHLFDEVLLFGPSEASFFKSSDLLFSFANPNSSASLRSEAQRVKEAKDLLSYAVTRENEVIGIPTEDVPSEIHESTKQSGLQLPRRKTLRKIHFFQF